MQFKLKTQRKEIERLRKRFKGQLSRTADAKLNAAASTIVALEMVGENLLFNARGLLNAVEIYLADSSNVNNYFKLKGIVAQCKATKPIRKTGTKRK